MKLCSESFLRDTDLCDFVNARRIAYTEIQQIVFSNGKVILFYWEY